MTVWLVSIVGIVALTLLVDIIVPQGESNKYIKGVLAAVATLVLVQPIPAVLNGSIDIEQYFQGEETFLDEELARNLENIKSSQIETSVVNLLESKGVGNALVTVDFEDETNYTVTVNLKNVVIADNQKHIFNSKLVPAIIEKELGIPAERIKIYGS